MTKLKLHWQIIICMIVGTIIGMIINTNQMQDSALYTIAVLLADIFVRILKMVIVTLIFTSIIMGVSSISDRSKIGRLGFKTLLYYRSVFIIFLTLVDTPSADSFADSLIALIDLEI